MRGAACTWMQLPLIPIIPSLIQTICQPAWAGGMPVLPCCENPTWRGRKASRCKAVLMLLPVSSVPHSPLHPPLHPHRAGPAPAVCAGEGKPSSLPSGSSCRLHECSFPVQFLTNLGCLQPCSCRAGRDGWPGSPAQGQTAGPC